MSHSLARRKSSLKGISTLRRSSGPVLKFRWSTSVANLTLLDDNLSVTFPSIDTHRSQENIFVTSLSSTGTFHLMKISNNEICVVIFE